MIDKRLVIALKKMIEIYFRSVQPHRIHYNIYLYTTEIQCAIGPRKKETACNTVQEQLFV